MPATVLLPAVKTPHRRARSRDRASCGPTRPGRLVPAHGIRDGTGRTRCPRAGQGEPVLGTVAEVHLPRAKGGQSAEPGCLIAMDRFDVKVQPVLGELR